MAPAKPLPGVFLALEGIDGSGKSTIARELATAVRATGHEAVVTREPGGTAIGEHIRDILLGAESAKMFPETEALLFAAARAQHVAEVIRPALGQGAIVISDRFTDSSLAYQWGGRGLPLELVQAAQRLATGGLSPDLKFLLDMPVEVAQRRRLADDGQTNRLDLEEVGFHERVHAAYHALVALDEAHWRVVDAARPLDQVLTDVVDAINASGLLKFQIDPADAKFGSRSVR